MGKEQFRCTCGEVFAKRWRLSEHIALMNPHWPRSSPQDTHFACSTKQTYVTAFIAISAAKLEGQG